MSRSLYSAINSTYVIKVGGGGEIRVFVKSIREHNWAFKNNWFQNKPLLFFYYCVSTAPFFFLFFFFPFLRYATVSELRVWHALLILLSLMRAHRSGIVGGVLFFAKCMLHTLSPRVFHYPRRIFMFSALSFILSLCIYSSQFFCLRTSANTFTAENYSFDSIFTFLFPLHFYNWLSIF